MNDIGIQLITDFSQPSQRRATKHIRQETINLEDGDNMRGTRGTGFVKESIGIGTAVRFWSFACYELELL